MSEANSYKIAVIGMAGRFPGARNIDEFWEKLCAGQNCISFLTEEQLRAEGVPSAKIENPNYVRAAPVLEGVEQFDAAFFGATPREADLMDPQHRLFLECCWEALENAGYNPAVHRHPVGLFAGARTDTYLLNLLTHPEMVEAVGMLHLGLGNDLGFLSTRVAHCFNLEGPSCSVQTACSTSLVAVHFACQSLLLDECRMALAGGVAVNVPHAVGYIYEEGSVQSPDGCCRTFDAEARGTVFGSGLGVVVLKRLEDALADRDYIHAIIRGSAINNDGSRKASFTAPSVQGQLRVIREALLNAGVPASDISYVECHGTGTLLGDAIELRALSRAFGQAEAMTCALGSVKTNVGHLDAAAGIAGLIKVILSLKHKILPPTLHFRRPNPQIDLAGSPFYINTTLLPWDGKKKPRRAGVSAFGVGGTNAHVILEEAPQPVGGDAGQTWHLLPLSARTPASLANMRRNLAAHLRHHLDQDLADIGYTLQVGRQRFACRDTVVGQNREQMVELLEQEIDQKETSVSGVDGFAPPVVFLFPGQGAQQEGMGKELYREMKVFRNALDSCSEILHPLLGLDLTKLLWDRIWMEGSMETGVDQTWLTQPALVAVEYALAQTWMSLGVWPKAMMGHSVGEYTAACLAGVMTIEEVLGAVAARGRLMQQCPPGAMLAVGLGQSDLVREVNTLNGHNIEIAGWNAPDLCTVAGRKEEVEKLEAQLREKGISCQRLHTSHAFHCSLVEGAESQFLVEMKKVQLKRPQIPFVSNVSGKWIGEEAQDPSYWVRQMRSPFRLNDGLNEAMREPGQVLLEIGPGQTLRRLALRQSGVQGTKMVLASLRGKVAEGKSMAEALGRMWEAGVEVDWQGLHGDARRRVPLPTYVFDRHRHWIDPVPTNSYVASVSRKTKKTPNISEWFWVPTWKSSKTLSRNFEDFDQPQTWVILANDLQIEAELAHVLSQGRQRIVRVRKGTEFQRGEEDLYSFDICASSHWRQLLESVQIEVREATRFIVWLGNILNDAGGSRAAMLEQYRQMAFNTLLGLFQAIAADNSDAERRVWIADKNLFLIESQDSIIPEKGGLPSLCRIAAQEVNGLECSLIDTDSKGPENRCLDLDSLIKEIKAGTMEPVVALRGKNRWVQNVDQLSLNGDSPSARKLVPGGVYMITGGMGAVGVLIAQTLVSSWNARVVLVGRSPLPSREQWPGILAQQPHDRLAYRLHILASLEEQGAKIEMLQADVSNLEEMRSAVEHCYRQFGSLDGVIHAAGVTQGPTVFCSLSDLASDAFRIQAQPKMQGLYVLSEVLREREVPFVAAVSSNAAVLGGLGLAAYAAANGLMDSFVAHQAAQGGATAWISMNWDHWPEETKQLTSYHTSLDEYAMTREEALEATNRILRSFDAGQIIVATGNLRERLSLWTQGKSSHPNVPAIESAANPRPAVKSVYAKPRTETEKKLAQIWQEFLGLEPVGIHDDFFELGGHSLMATRLVAQIRSTMNVEIPLAKLFEGPTIAQMSEVLVQLAGDGKLQKLGAHPQL